MYLDVCKTKINNTTCLRHRTFWSSQTFFNNCLYKCSSVKTTRNQHGSSLNISVQNSSNKYKVKLLGVICTILRLLLIAEIHYLSLNYAQYSFFLSLSCYNCWIMFTHVHNVLKTQVPVVLRAYNKHC